jgi:quinol monooxygenase YgiN
MMAIGAAALGVSAVSSGQSKMYGLIGKMRTQPGQRDALIAILLAGTGSMPGCLSYVVAKDPADADGLWITEVWDSQESHKASLALPSVKEAISKGRPLIAGFDQHNPTEPVGGIGLRRSG